MHSGGQLVVSWKGEKRRNKSELHCIVSLWQTGKRRRQHQWNKMKGVDGRGHLVELLQRKELEIILGFIKQRQESRCVQRGWVSGWMCE